MRTSRAERVTLLSLFALAFSGVAACSSYSSTDVYTSVVGVYTLTTVDGVVLPAPAKDATGAALGKITSGGAVLTDTKTFTSSVNYTLTNGVTGSSPNAGTYAVSGSTVTLTSTTGSDQTIATFSGGNTLTATANQQVYVLKK